MGPVAPAQLFDGQSVRSCLMFAVQANGAEITTVEETEQVNQLHPLQESSRMPLPSVWLLYTRVSFDLGALSGTTLNSSEEEIRKAISGNLCCCTGYQNIVAAIDYIERSKQSETQILRSRRKEKGRLPAPDRQETLSMG